MIDGFELPDSILVLIIVVPIGRMSVINYFCFEEREIGLVRYYYSDVGEIVYEDVSDSNIYFSCWLCF